MKQLFIASRKGLMVYQQTEGGLERHSEHFLGDPVSAFCCDDEGAWYAALNLGHFGPKMRRSRDQGKTWQEISCPALPEGAKNAEGKEASLDQIWTLEVLNDAPGHLLAGTNPAALFETTDGGETWQLNEPFWQQPEREKMFGGGFDTSGVHSLAIHPDRPSTWTMAISVGGVWHSDNAGESWTLACKGMRAAYMPEDMADDEANQDPHRLVQSKANPERMWVQHHNGVFVSDDRGKTWRECFYQDKSIFGFGVVTDPLNADRAWFIPGIKDEARYPIDASLTVLMTEDGGQTFQPIRSGLPNEPSYDLVYRHGFAIDAQGQHLVFGSTTGNLWWSKDHGKTFEIVSHHLPPIYAVTVVG